MKPTYTIMHADSRRYIAQLVMQAPQGHVVTISEPTRSTDQNAKLWASLTDIANNVVWHGRKLDQTSWKHIFTSSLKRQEVVPNLDGTGFVVMGISTSRMTKSEMSELIELIAAFGAQHNVEWSA